MGGPVIAAGYCGPYRAQGLMREGGDGERQRRPLDRNHGERRPRIRRAAASAARQSCTLNLGSQHRREPERRLVVERTARLLRRERPVRALCRGSAHVC